MYIVFECEFLWNGKGAHMVLKFFIKAGTILEIIVSLNDAFLHHNNTQTSIAFQLQFKSQRINQ